MKRPFKIELINEKTDFKVTPYLDDDHSTPVQVEQKSYTCPICKKHKSFLMVDGKIVKGGSASTGINGCWVSHCGDLKCSMKAQRMAKGWRLWLREQVDDLRWWLAQRTARLTAWLRREKWHLANTWAGVPGNRAAELRQAIWEDIVTLKAIEDHGDDLEAIGDKLSELAQLANETWGHYPSDWAKPTDARSQTV